MSRVQLALNVADLDRAVSFYERLFATKVSKKKPGYANFAIVDPPLKLVLIENSAASESLNHLGIEVENSDLVAQAGAALEQEGLSTLVENEVACCFALQNKVLTNSPDGDLWEIYTVLSDIDTNGESPCCDDTAVPCCSK